MQMIVALLCHAASEHAHGFAQMDFLVGAMENQDLLQDFEPVLVRTLITAVDKGVFYHWELHC